MKSRKQIITSDLIVQHSLADEESEKIVETVVSRMPC